MISWFWNRYSNENAQWHPAVAEIYVDGVPEFLWKKSPWFITHCLVAMELASDYNTKDIEEYDVMMFKVLY